MTKSEYDESVLELDIRGFRFRQQVCDIEVRQSELNSEKDLLDGQLAELEKERLQLEIDWAQSKIDGETGYEDQS
jgi:hypothetical protein